MVDVVREGKDLLKRCHDISDVRVVQSFVCVPAHRRWQVSFEHVIYMVDGIA
jgi:hypothetical protein